MNKKSKIFEIDWLFLTGIFPNEKKRLNIIDKNNLTYVTAFVPSDTACLASSPGNKSRTAVWISRDEIVWRLLYCVNREASLAIRSRKYQSNFEIKSKEIYPTENIINKAIHNRHCFTRNTRIRMNLIQH